VKKIHDINLFVTVDVIKFECQDIKCRLHIILLQDLKMLDEARNGDLCFVNTVTKHEIDHFCEVRAVVTEDILHISDNV
jgi:hypothetical protein